MTTQEQNPVFDYRALRLLVGVIAFILPILVSLISSTALSSISASYHTDARDVFVGLMFIVGSFLWAYNGHGPTEKMASKWASLAAILVALCPIECDTCAPDKISHVHEGAAFVLFAILAYFCFLPFRENTKGRGGAKGLRSKVYFTCGSIMVICMLVYLGAKLTMTRDAFIASRIAYYIERTALAAFGISWIVAGKYIPFLADPGERLRLLDRRKPAKQEVAIDLDL